MGVKKPGSIWIEGNDIHYIDTNTDEWSFTGELVLSAPAAIPGSIWISLGGRLHYIDATNGYRRLARVDDGLVSAAKEGSVWQDSAYLNWVANDLHKYHGHDDIAHTDSSPHTDTPHGDSHGDDAHGDSHGDSHGDTSHGDSHTDNHEDTHGDSHLDTPSPHADTHNDFYLDTHDDVAHDDVGHDDSHSDSAHTDSSHNDTHSDDAHGDGGSHGDVAHADQPVFIGQG